MIFIQFITLLEAPVIISEINLLYNTLHLLGNNLAKSSSLFITYLTSCNQRTILSLTAYVGP